MLDDLFLRVFDLIKHYFSDENITQPIEPWEPLPSSSSPPEEAGGPGGNLSGSLIAGFDEYLAILGSAVSDAGWGETFCSFLISRFCSSEATCASSIQIEEGSTEWFRMRWLPAVLPPSTLLEH